MGAYWGDRRIGEPLLKRQRDARIKALFSIAPAWQRIVCTQKGSVSCCVEL
jgi:hypothetical protein